MRRTITLAIALLLLVAMAVPALAGGNQGKAGKSDIYHCYFPIVMDDEYEGDAWGKIMVQDLDGTLAFVVNFHDLDSGYMELKSGGNILASGMPNKGGNLNLSGTTEAWGRAFNLWIDGTRTLRTEFDLCTPEMPTSNG